MGETVFKIKERLSLREIEEYKEVLQEHFDHREPLIIDIENLVHIDTSGFQLLLMAQKHARKLGVPFQLKGSTPEFRHSVEFLGLDLLLKESVAHG